MHVIIIMSTIMATHMGMDTVTMVISTITHTATQTMMAIIRAVTLSSFRFSA